MSGKKSRTKGHSFERAVAITFREVYPDAQRLLEYQEGYGIDLDKTGIFRVQCKAYKQYAPISKINEIPKGDYIPVLVTKGDRLTPMVVLPLDNFIELLKKIDIEEIS